MAEDFELGGRPLSILGSRETPREAENRDEPRPPENASGEREEGEGDVAERGGLAQEAGIQPDGVEKSDWT